MSHDHDHNHDHDHSHDHEHVDFAQQRAAILSDLQKVFEQELAFREWGRLLIELAKDKSGALRVADVVVEEIVDEALVERLFEQPAAGQVMSGLPVVIEALVGLAGDADLEKLGGGTFVRFEAEDGDKLEFLPGLVRAPSVGFDSVRERVLAQARENDLVTRFDLAGAVVQTDMELGALRFVRGETPIAEGRQVVLGSFAKPARAWVWAAFNPSLNETAKARASALLDAMPDRSAWEITTPGLVTDQPTAWALAWWVALENKLLGVVRVDTDDGFVVLGVESIEPR